MTAAAAGAFFDSNVALYLLGADEAKAARAEDLLSQGGTISVQVLNEFANVARRKFDIAWPIVFEALESLRHSLDVVPLTLAIHLDAMRLAREHRFAIYDALIVAAALDAGCATLYSEDLQHGRIIDRRLRIVDPFR